MSYYGDDDDNWDDEYDQPSGSENGSDEGVHGYELHTDYAGVDADGLRDFASMCRRTGLTRDQATDLLGYLVDKARADDSSSSAYEERVLAGWKDELKRDADFGGSNYQRTIANAKRALEVYDTSGDLRRLLRDTKFQHNPAVIKCLAMVGRELGERRINSRTDRDLASRMFPGM